VDTASAVDPSTGEANPYLAEVAADPVPFYEALRRDCPVASFTGFGDGHWIVSRYEDVRHVLKAPEVFSSDLEAVDIGQERPLIPLQIDPPEHARYRRVIDPTLGPREVEPMEQQVRDLADRLLDGFVERGGVDAHAEFTVPFPCTVFLDLCGLPLENLTQFLEWKDNIVRPAVSDPAEAADLRRRTARSIYEYFGGEIDRRQARPGEDLLSRFLTSEVDGRRMSREEMLDICFLFLLGGLDTVTSTLDCSLAYLAAHPEHRSRLAGDPARTADAVEELLRLHTPVMQVLRVVTEPVELRGVEMQPGDTVVVMLGAADTDSAEFGADAEAFVLDRTSNRHFAFGGGPHRCLGSHLARLELRVALEAWHRRVPDYRVAEGVELAYSPGIREIAELPLVFEAEPSEVRA
jgi:cytochrome P450